MRVLCFLPDLDGGGAERTMVNLVNAFPSVGFESTLAVARGDGAALRWVTDLAVVRDLGAGRTRLAGRPLRQAIRRFKPDLVFSTMVDANIVAAAVIQTVRNMPIILRETNSHRARGDMGFLRRRLAGWAYRRVDAVVALSEGVRRELIEDYRLAEPRAVTLPNPVDVGAFEAAARSARARPSPSPGGPLLVAIGRLTRQKGFDILIDAFARLRADGMRLAILGEGPDKAALADQARRLGIADRVLMPGFVDAPADWLAHAEAFILSSRWEGFGHVIVEAMAARAPVIATDCPHGPTDIIDDGRNGILVPLGEGVEERLRDRIDGLLAAPERAQALRESAAADARQYEAATVAGRYAELFRRVVDARRGPR